MNEEILLLDDDLTMLSILDGILSSSGYVCTAKTDPNEALTLVVERPQIAVVLSDILMPGLTGLQFVDRLNAMSLGRAPPRVLLLTAKPTLERAVDALRLGVRDFLVKPIRPPELIEAVERAMSQARRDRLEQNARPPQVEQLLRQAEELAGRLRTLAYSSEMEAEDAADAALAAASSEAPVETPGATPGSVSARARPAQPEGDSLAILDTIEQLRRLRSRYESHKLDDVAWDLLLELLRAERLRQKLSVSGLAISISGVSATTSLRRMNELAARGYIERVPDPSDARRDFVALTQKSQELLADYLTQANAHVSAITP